MQPAEYRIDLSGFDPSIPPCGICRHSRVKIVHDTVGDLLLCLTCDGHLPITAAVRLCLPARLVAALDRPRL